MLAAFALRALGLVAAEQSVLALLLAAGIGVYAWNMLAELFRGHFGVDLIALTAILASALLAQWWAGAVILLMLTGGEALEAYAMRRARRQLAALLSSLPTVAHLKRGEIIEDVDPARLAVGDVVVVKPGETVPADGVVLSGISTADVSRLTGESLPVDVGPHTRLYAGSINQAGLIELRTLSDASQSQYARMLELIRHAEQSKAPIVRLADAYSGTFTLVTFALAGLAWAFTGDPLRVLAVLVVATPCPLILATPIAIISGVSRAAGRGIIVKQGGALETLARVKAMVFDKTGTLTFGNPTIRDAFGQGLTPHEVLRLAASLDQASTHVLAGALVRHAASQGMDIAFPADMREIPGKGVTGTVDGQAYAFGRLSFLAGLGVRIPTDARAVQAADRDKGIRTVYLARDKDLVGGVRFSDTLRAGLDVFIASLSRQGIEHIAMLTGDKAGAAREVAKAIGITHVRAECLPEDKVHEVEAIRRDHAPVAMIGDGINDSPALAVADVGIALASDTAGMASDAADIVLTVDDITKVGEALTIAQRTVSVAKTGIFVGMGLSFGLMGLAAIGIITPLYGAVLQEVVDVLVIVNALRAHREA